MKEQYYKQQWSNGESKIRDLDTWPEHKFNCPALQNFAKEKGLFNECCVSCSHRKKLVKQMIEEEENIDYIKNVNVIDFSEFKKYLGQTNHLINFELADELFPLSGEKYKSLKKLLIYQVNSLIQPTLRFFVGVFSFDNRNHILIFTTPGKGKSTVDNGMSKALKGIISIKDAGFISHVEQLKGTIEARKTGKGENKKTELIKHEGLLDESDLLKIDEAYDTLNESTTIHSESMRTLRKAMDTYLENEVSKPQVLFGDDALKFNSKSRILITTHPKKFKPIFISSGTSRRFFANEITNEGINIQDSTRGLLLKKAYTDEEIKKYLLEQQINLKHIKEITFEEEAIKETIEWIDAFNEFLVYNDNKDLRNIGIMLYLPIKHHFFKTIAIHSISQNVTKVTKRIAEQGCADTIEFLLNTIETYARWNNFTSGLNPWGVTDDRMADVCDWMLSKGATSKGESKLSSSDVKKAIARIFGKHDRQASEYWAKMKKLGLIKSSTSNPYTAWLGKKPEISFENDCIGGYAGSEKSENPESANAVNILGAIYENSLQKSGGGMQTMQCFLRLTQKLKNYSESYYNKEEKRFENGIDLNCKVNNSEKNETALFALQSSKNTNKCINKNTALSAWGSQEKLLKKEEKKANTLATLKCDGCQKLFETLNQRDDLKLCVACCQEYDQQ